MGKRSASERPKPKKKVAKRSTLTFSDIKSPATLMKKLQGNPKYQSANGILPKIHSIIKQGKKKIHFDYRKLKEKLRICKKCDKWNQINSIIQCVICEDNYHNTCLGIDIIPDYVCLQCKDGRKTQKYCGKCKKDVIQIDKKVCQGCSLIFHENCLNKKMKTCRKCINFESITHTTQKKPKKPKPSIPKPSIKSISQTKIPSFQSNLLSSDT